VEHYSDDSIPYTNSAITVDDTCEPLIWVEYRGPYKYAKIKAATTTGDITLTADDTDGATTNFNAYLPGEVVTANTNAAINLSDAAWSTWGEVVDEINEYNCDGWYAWLDSALREDLTEASAGALVAIARNTAVTCWRKPVALYHDTTALMNDDANEDYMYTLGLTNKKYANDSNEGRVIELSSYSFQCTGTKAATHTWIQVWDCDDVAKTETKIYQIAAGATTVAKQEGEDDWGNKPITSGIGNRLVIRETNDATLSVPSIVARWRSVPVVPRGTATLNGTSVM